MNEIPCDEFFEKFFFYRKALPRVTSIERALEDLRIKYNFTISEINEIRDEVLGLMEPEE